MVQEVSGHAGRLSQTAFKTLSTQHSRGTLKETVSGTRRYTERQYAETKGGLSTAGQELAVLRAVNGEVDGVEVKTTRAGKRVFIEDLPVDELRRKQVGAHHVLVDKQHVRDGEAFEEFSGRLPARVPSRVQEELADTDTEDGGSGGRRYSRTPQAFF